MKVVILGGYGVFGERTARLLVRDGHDVVIAGRSMEKAQILADDLDATALTLDRTGDLSLLLTVKPDVVVDAAGPFHSYGDDPYRLAHFALSHGIHYLDLADDADFCIGLAQLDDLAKENGCFALSGLSSVPAVSSAVVQELSKDMDSIEMIDTAILPGNRAPRGKSVVAGILSQAGTDIPMMIGGKWQMRRSWSGPVAYDLSSDMRRKGWLIEVPDLKVFPEVFQARSVFFRAGLELGVMNYGLAAISWMRSKVMFPVQNWLIVTMLFSAKMLWFLGSDRGGMVVHVTGATAGTHIRRSWRLVAEQGEGPFIPAVATRAALRNPQGIAPGARVSAAVISLHQIEDAVSDLAVITTTEETELQPIFQTVLGPVFRELPPLVQASHQTYGVLRLVGKSTVTRGTGLISRLLGWVFRFPKADDDISVEVVKIRTQSGETWHRHFGKQTFKSHLAPATNGMTERFGPFTFLLGLQVKGDALVFPVTSAKIFGGIPMPKWLLPISVSHETQSEGKFRFDVRLSAPLGIGLVVHYRGYLEPV
ncbi:SDR family oxidoreductase [Parasulfitobacter algicola]|uniref:DUF4166 domain-containing protein n=1 Tax=Parasulfitobacter algicola TaxID=2614809 RepID=A0ABX2ISJ0_9RHOB|nr:SDR family oxidoreductase [Sulfitobacter algicola]NSX55515.1 DUF4166 domain-containing protein [Sulfitobacter algicola]